MAISRKSRRFAPVVFSTLLMTGALLATAAQDTASPRQVVGWLDGIVQPRFQKDEGQFGVDRVMIGGHDDVYELGVKTPEEKRSLAKVKAARHPFILAFLHCTHKPGRTGGAVAPTPSGGFQPFISVLASATKTQRGVGKLYDWGERHLQAIAVPSLPQLRRGMSVDVEYGNWLVSMRPVQATQESCIGCHAGAKRGDTLGVMVYAVDKNTNQAPLAHLENAGGV